MDHFAAIGRIGQGDQFHRLRNGNMGRSWEVKVASEPEALLQSLE